MARTNTTRQSINNLVRNGDFEFAPEFTAEQTANGTWIDGTATGSSSAYQYGWAIPAGASASAFKVSYDSTVSYSGSNSLKVEVTNATGFAIITNYSPSVPASKDKLIPCLPSTSYTLTAKVKTLNVATYKVFIRLRTISGAYATISTQISDYLNGTNDWTTLSVVYTTEANARFIAPMFGLEPGQASTVWFDDITLSPTTPITRLPA